MTGDLLPIDKVAKASGVASSALRYYERVGLIEEGSKIGGKRHYPRDVLNRLSMIRTCQTIGFSLTEIASLLHEAEESDGSWQEIAAERRNKIQREIEERQAWLRTLNSTLACACPQLVECPRVVGCPLLVTSDR
ncbi:MerR family transcriptional regulator [Saccharothrix deserti]|uniref:MerR family transcriptional regulator n=1 Tax=Saccharothrix deserti TaxID=2593674 RepID=UPI00131D3075|nr:MerR family transcriptional regulator [Saccharothrix deserti]